MSDGRAGKHYHQRREMMLVDVRPERDCRRMLSHTPDRVRTRQFLQNAGEGKCSAADDEQCDGAAITRFGIYKCERRREKDRVTDEPNDEDARGKWIGRD